MKSDNLPQITSDRRRQLAAECKRRQLAAECRRRQLAAECKRRQLAAECKRRQLAAECKRRQLAAECKRRQLAAECKKQQLATYNSANFCESFVGCHRNLVAVFHSYEELHSKKYNMQSLRQVFVSHC